MDGIRSLTASCRCGACALELVGAPIVTVICHCHSCQEAAAGIGEPEGGGADFVLQRKDRVRCVTGGERLREHRLTPTSPTRRMVAGCCNSAMFLEFAGGHWLSVYRGRLPDGAPPAEMRVMTGDRPQGAEPVNDLPAFKTHSGRFMWKLLTAWIAMGFRIPKVQGVPA